MAKNIKANHVRQRLSNIQQSYPGHMDLMIKELEELERLARIGRATEKAFSESNSILILNIQISADDVVEFGFENVPQLLEWAESEGE